MRQDWTGLVAVLDRLIVLLPQAWHEHRDRGLAYAAQGQTERAVADLQTYLDHAQDILDADAVAERISALRHRAGR